MLSANREDYIKKVYQTNELNEKLTNKDLAASLEVSPASSSEMIKKLIASGHVIKDEDLGFKLTQKGLDEGSELIRNHRLWEYFLVNNLGYSWSEVHEEAELLEHATSEILGDRLNDYLGRPKYCPHGSLIYGNSTEKTSLSLLSTLSVGMHGVVRKVEDDDKSFLEYLEDKNLMRGTEFEVIEIEPYEGPYHLQVGSKVHLLSYKAANQIWVSQEVIG